MNLRLFFFLFLPLLFSNTSANAYMVRMNARIDDAMEADARHRVVVYATIEKVYREEETDSGKLVIGFGPEMISVDLRIHEVILGDTTCKDSVLKFDISYFVWPQDLVKIQEGNQLLLILSEDYNHPENFMIDVVVPCVSKVFGRLKSKDDAIHFFARELIHVVDTPVDAIQCRAALQQLGPILPMDHATPIWPLLGHSDQWVRLAATVAVVYATEEPKALRMLATDMQQFFSTTDEDSSVMDETGNYSYSPFYLYKQCLFFVNPYCGEWEEEFVNERMKKECRIIEKILALGVLDKKVLRILEDEF